MRKFINVQSVKTALLLLLMLSSGFSGCICDNDNPIQNSSVPQLKSSLLISTDAGENWTVKAIGSQSELNNLCYSYSTGGYRIVVSGHDGVVLNTLNYGETFSNSGPFSGFSFYGAGFSASDGRITLTSGSNNFVASTDGGETWYTRSTGNLFISYIDINPALTLFQAACSIGDRKNIYISTNGGNNWIVKSADAGNDDDFCGIRFVRGNIILAYGADGLMLRSTNYGENWSRITLPATSRIISAACNFEWQTVVSNTNLSGKFLKSTDLGSTWELKDIVRVNGYTPDKFAMSYSGEVFGVGVSGSMAKSTDMGETWRVIQSGTDANFKDIIYINNSLMAALAFKQVY